VGRLEVDALGLGALDDEAGALLPGRADALAGAEPTDGAPGDAGPAERLARSRPTDTVRDAVGAAPAAAGEALPLGGLALEATTCADVMVAPSGPTTTRVAPAADAIASASRRSAPSHPPAAR
jgi:hypothetical protein